MTATAERPAPAWDTVHPTRPGQGLIVTLAVGFLLPGLLATALRVFPPVDDRPALLASFVPFGIIGYLAATVLLVVALLRARRRAALGVVALVSAAGLAYHTATLVPYFVPDQRGPTSSGFSVFTLNTQYGQADPAQLAAEARTADVVVLVEATPDAMAQLDARGLRVRFPYVTGSTQEANNGSVVYSRFPLRNSAALPASSFQQWATTVEVPGVGDVRLLAVHPCNPFCGGNAWTREHAVLRAAAAEAADEGPLVIAGDYNAIDDHGPMRQLYATGLRSATDLVGAGWLPTWPANSVIPPLLPIDHVLLNDDLTATSIGTVRIDGTDHLGVRAVIAGTG